MVGVTAARITGWDAQMTLSGQWENQASRTSAPKQSLERLRWEERLQLRFFGYALSPQLVRFRFGGGIGFSQEDLRQDGIALDGDGALYEYDLSATFFEKKPIRLTTFANRNQQTESRAFAPRTVVENRVTGGGLRFNWRPFPSSLSFRREKIDKETAFEGLVNRWARTGDKLFYQGGRQWRRATLNLQFRHETVTDHVHPDFGYRLRQGGLSHRFLIGAGKKNHLTTTARYFVRQGPSDLTFSNFYGSERVSFSPARNLKTAFGIIVDRDTLKDDNGGTDNATTATTGFLHISHQLYESLNSRLDSDVVATDFPLGAEKRYRLRPAFDYRKRIPWNGRLTLGLAGRYEQVDRDAIGRATAEEHAVTALPFRFELSLPVATLGGLSILNPDKGTILTEGSDYVLTPAAEKVIIEIIGTDPTRVAPGDRLLVRYQFVSHAPIRFETRTLSARIGFDFSRVSASYQRETQLQRLMSGGDAADLDDVTWETVALQFRYHPKAGTLFSLNEYRRYNSDRLAYRTWYFSQAAGYRLPGKWRINLQMLESSTDYRVPPRETNRVNARIHLTWRPEGGWELSPFAGWQTYKDTAAPDESIRTVGLRGRCTWGKLELVAFAQYESRRRNGSEINDTQVDLRLTRRF